MVSLISDAMKFAGDAATFITMPMVGIAIFIVTWGYKVWARSGNDLIVTVNPWQRKAAIVALVVAGIAYLVDISDRFGWLTELQDAMPLKEVRGQTFENERVVLDGFDYIDCTFTNVTLVFNGHRSAVSYSHFHGGASVSSDVPLIQNVFSFLNSTGFLRVPLVTRNGVILPYGEAPIFGPGPPTPIPTQPFPKSPEMKFDFKNQ